MRFIHALEEDKYCPVVDVDEPLNFRICGQSTSDFAHEALGFLDRVFVEASVSDVVKDDVRIAVGEAVMNAIMHGNNQDPSKEVAIEIEVTPTELMVSVQDEGIGFEPGVVVDPRLPENLGKPSGRGILMMNAFMDHVEIVPAWSGTLVKMTKNLEPHSVKGMQI